MTLATQPVSLTTELPGRTSPFRVAEVRPQVNGIVQKRLFTEGGEVKAGQQLYQIDPALYQASLDSQKAALARAQAQQKTAALLAERYKPLVATRAVSQQTYDNAVASRDQAAADVLNANRNASPRGRRSICRSRAASGTARSRTSTMCCVAATMVSSRSPAAVGATDCAITRPPVRHWTAP